MRVRADACARVEAGERMCGKSAALVARAKNPTHPLFPPIAPSRSLPSRLYGPLTSHKFNVHAARRQRLTKNKGNKNSNKQLQQFPRFCFSTMSKTCLFFFYIYILGSTLFLHCGKFSLSFAFGSDHTSRYVFGDRAIKYSILFMANYISLLFARLKSQ